MAAIGKMNRGRRKHSPRTGPRRPIDAAAEERICRIIRTWPEAVPLTGEALVGLISTSEGGGWTRQALSRHEAITDAFAKRKGELRKGKKAPKDPLVIVLQRQVADRDARIAQLEKLLAHYEERFVAMIRNATARGLTQAELEAPLPPIDRR